MSHFKIEWLNASIKLTLLKALIRSVMTYACTTWEFAAETHLLKLHRLQNRVLRSIGILSRHTSILDLHVAFQIPYVYGYITKLCIWSWGPDGAWHQDILTDRPSVAKWLWPWLTGQGSVWTEAATYSVILNVITSLHKKPQGTARIDFFSA
jgi:hypothetical protein